MDHQHSNAFPLSLIDGMKAVIVGALWLSMITQNML